MSHESISALASRTTYAGATVAAGSAGAQAVIPQGVQETILGLTLNQWTVLGIAIGAACAIAGFVVNWIYKQRHFNLAKAGIEVAQDGD